MKTIDGPKVLACLGELSSRKFQERAWLAENGPCVSSFPELVSQLFDDTGLSDVLGGEHLEETVGAEGVIALKELDAAIVGVEASLAPAALIAHPSMERVRQCACHALEVLERRLSPSQGPP